MAIINNKKGFAFTFLALFLSFLIFAFGSYYLFHGNFTNGKSFDEARIAYLSNDITYFKEVYVKNVLGFSFYNVLDSIENNPAVLKSINQNYTRLNQLVYEGLINGSFDGNAQNSLKNKTLSYFVDAYEKDFKKNSKGNFSFKILAINVFEKQPYYVSLQVVGEYNVTTIDNISSWNFIDDFDISVPVYNLKDPEFLLTDNLTYFIRPYELYESNINWTLANFNSTLVNNYSIIYTEPKHEYTLGTSFLNRLLNNSKSSYKDVLGFWSFDYDLSKGGVYDTSLHSGLGNFYSQTRLLMTFDNNTIIGGSVKDLTSYNDSGSIIGGVNCQVAGESKEACEFDGKTGEINISKDGLNLNNTNQVSISAWIYPKNYVDLQSGKGSEIFRYGVNESNVIDLRLSPAGKLLMQIGNHSNGNFYTFSSNINVSLNKWSNVIGIFDGNTGIGKLYIDGKPVNLDYYGNFPKSAPISHFVKSGVDIGIGNLINRNEHFNGSIDELGVYSKVLDDNEIARVYGEKKTQFIDYKDSLYGQGVEFNGKKNYVNVSVDFNLAKNFSIGFWIKPFDNSSGVSKREGILIFKNSTDVNSPISTDGMRFFLDASNKLEWDISPGVAEISNLKSSFDVGKWNYFVATFNGISSKLYHDGKLVKENKTADMRFSNVKTIYFSWLAGANFFNGVLDEVKIYNKTLSPESIQENYYNYAGNAKGCCNYITLINPNTMGYNNSAYNDNVSYSSKMFYDHYKRGFSYNITLWNVTNITSHVTGNSYYNFALGDCMMQAFNVYSYDFYSSKIHTGQYNDSCSNFVSEGFY